MPDQYKKDSYIASGAYCGDIPLPFGWQGNGGEKEDNEECVLNFLKTNGFITDALSKARLNIANPQPYVHNLNQKGHKIKWDRTSKKYVYEGKEKQTGED